MRLQHVPSWLVGFCWAMIPAAVMAMVVGDQLGTTHAIAQVRRGKETAGLQALRTSQALRTDTKVLETGQLVQGDAVNAELTVRNVWKRPLRLDVDLAKLPGWTASLERTVLQPGESTLLHLGGVAGQPGELDGVVHITALHDFLSLRVAVKGQVTPKPVDSMPPAEGPGTNEQPASQPHTPGEGKSSVKIGLMPRGDQAIAVPKAEQPVMPEIKGDQQGEQGSH